MAKLEGDAKMRGINMPSTSVVEYMRRRKRPAMGCEYEISSAQPGSTDHIDFLIH